MLSIQLAYDAAPKSDDSAVDQETVAADESGGGLSLDELMKQMKNMWLSHGVIYFSIYFPLSPQLAPFCILDHVVVYYEAVKKVTKSNFDNPLPIAPTLYLVSNWYFCWIAVIILSK